MIVSNCTRLTVLALLCFALIRASASFEFLPQNLSSWSWQGSVVVDQWLYIDSGEVWAGGYWGQWINFTLSIDLSKDWRTNTIVPIVTPKANGHQMLTRRPTMWYDPISKDVFWYGGWPYENNTEVAVWGFTPNDQGTVKWTQKYTGGIGKNTTGSGSFSGFTVTAGSLFAASPTTYYSLGGFMTNFNDPALSQMTEKYQPTITGLVTYDFQTTTWSNTSSNGYQQSGFGIRGQAIFVPVFGKEGILVFLGGDAPSTRTYVEGESLVPMTDITIYDIKTGKFYVQKASGSNIPVPRISFCAVGQGAAGSSTFVFGGKQGGALNTQSIDPKIVLDLGSVYILTLPAFQWIKVPGTVAQRAAHQCQIIGNRQMISIGGFMQNDAQIVDPWTNGLGVYDMTDLAWKFNYTANASVYLPSKLVTNIYGGRQKYPSVWGNSELPTIFNAPPQLETIAKRLDVAVIVGGAAGGIVGLIIVISIFIIWRRRVRDQDASWNEVDHSQEKTDISVSETNLGPQEVSGDFVVPEMCTGMVPEMNDDVLMGEMYAGMVSEMDATCDSEWKKKAMVERRPLEVQSSKSS